MQPIRDMLTFIPGLKARNTIMGFYQQENLRENRDSHAYYTKPSRGIESIL